MNINKEFVSEVNSSAGNTQKFIIIHETDNWSNGAGARTHAKAQCNGNFSNMSVHYYAGSDGVYKAAEHDRKCWGAGRDYSGGTANVIEAGNSNSIHIEICVNADGNYNVARQNAVELVKHLMKTTGIPADRVIRHYDAKGKYCPRNMMDNPALWEDFKAQIRQTEPQKPKKQGWIKEDNAWKYYVEGAAKHNCWFKDKGKWYYFHNSTAMASEEWIQDKGKWYYMDKDGHMVQDRWIESKSVKGKWYYLKKDGVMAANQVLNIKNLEYAFGSDGRMLRNKDSKDKQGNLI